MHESINKPKLNNFPPTITAWIIFAIALLIFSFSILAHLRMWQVELSLRTVAAGGGEYMVALFYGLPSLLVATTLMGITVGKQQWRSKSSVTIFTLCLTVIYGWQFTLVGLLAFTIILLAQSLSLLVKKWRPYAAMVFSLLPLVYVWGWYLWMISPEIKFLLT